MLSEAALARTFSPPSYTDPYEGVGDYRRVQRWASHHPESGSSAAASALNLPRSRIRPWMNGAKPDAVRAIETAEGLGWLGTNPTSAVGRAFTVLSSALLSGGSLVHDTYTPRVTIDGPRVTRRVVNALDTLECGSRRAHTDSGSRATEIVPADNASLFGRALTALGHPRGAKSNLNVSLPPFLTDLPLSMRADWVELYLLNRASEFAEKDTLTIVETLSAGTSRMLGFGRDGPYRRDDDGC